MPTLVLENVPAEVLDRLRERAAASNRSMGDEVVGLLQKCLPEPPLLTEEFSAPCDLPYPDAGEIVPTIDGGRLLPEPPLLPQDVG